jgi:D-tyrosyl-tRNA(Tyr) deacylase
VGDDVAGQIELGLVVLLGVEVDDTDEDARYLAGKLIGLRIFEDDQQKMNLSVSDVDGSILLVSQFTLLGDCRHGRRPSFIRAADPERAEMLYEQVAGELSRHVPVATGRFKAQMQVHLTNDGPVTILLDSRKAF